MSSPTPSQPQADPETLDVRLEVRFPANLDEMTKVADAVMEVVNGMECAQGHELGIWLALQEALVNAIQHGAGNDPSKSIEVKVVCEAEHGMLIIISDPGEGFDPLLVPDPQRAENLCSYHGRGLFLIRQHMDHVEFKRGGAEIHMRKFAKPADDLAPR